MKDEGEEERQSKRRKTAARSEPDAPVPFGANYVAGDEVVARRYATKIHRTGALSLTTSLHLRVCPDCVVTTHLALRTIPLGPHSGPIYRHEYLGPDPRVAGLYFDYDGEIHVKWWDGFLQVQWMDRGRWTFDVIYDDEQGKWVEKED